MGSQAVLSSARDRANGWLRGGHAAAPVRWWPFAALTLVVTVATAVGLLPRWPGAIHLVALPPIDLYADLRLLLTWAPSWPVFLLGLAGVLTVRIVVLALLLGGLTRQRLRLAAGFYLLALPLLMVAAMAAYAAATLLYSRMFWGALAIVAVVAMLAAPVPWQGPTRLREAVGRTWRAGLRVQVMLGYAVLLVVIGVLAQTRPAVGVALIPVSGAATLVAIEALTRPAPRHPRWRLAGAVVLLAVAATVFVVTRTVPPGPPAAPRRGSILLMSGINSASGRGTMFSSQAGHLGYDCGQTFYFSYAGPGDGQPQGRALCPIRTGAPYEPEDTQQPLENQVRAFAEPRTRTG